jgi:hypothetical protein
MVRLSQISAAFPLCCGSSLQADQCVQWDTPIDPFAAPQHTSTEACNTHPCAQWEAGKSTSSSTKAYGVLCLQSPAHEGGGQGGTHCEVATAAALVRAAGAPPADVLQQGVLPNCRRVAERLRLHAVLPCMPYVGASRRLCCKLLIIAHSVWFDVP